MAFRYRPVFFYNVKVVSGLHFLINAIILSKVFLPLDNSSQNEI